MCAGIFVGAIAAFQCCGCRCRMAFFNDITRRTKLLRVPRDIFCSSGVSFIDRKRESSVDMAYSTRENETRAGFPIGPQAPSGGGCHLCPVHVTHLRETGTGTRAGTETGTFELLDALGKHNHSESETKICKQLRRSKQGCQFSGQRFSGVVGYHVCLTLSGPQEVSGSSPD